MGRVGTPAGPRLATAAAIRPDGRSVPPHQKTKRTMTARAPVRGPPCGSWDEHGRHMERDVEAASHAISVGSAPYGTEAAGGRGVNDSNGAGSMYPRSNGTEP